MVLRGWLAIQTQRMYTFNMAEWTTIDDKRSTCRLLTGQSHVVKLQDGRSAFNAGCVYFDWQALSLQLVAPCEVVDRDT